MTDPLNSIILTGNHSALPGMITQAIAQHQDLLALDLESGGGADKEWFPDYKGKIILKVFFRESYADWKKSTRASPGRSQHKFYLMEEGYNLIRLERIQYWAERIKAEFNNYVLNRGKISVSYNDPFRGYNRIYEFCHTIVDGEQLFRRLVGVQNYPFQLKLVNHTQNLEPAIRYPDTPRKELIAGYEVKVPQLRPTCSLRFHKALMRFPRTRQYFKILDAKGTIISKLPNFIASQTY